MGPQLLDGALDVGRAPKPSAALLPALGGVGKGATGLRRRRLRRQHQQLRPGDRPRGAVLQDQFRKVVVDAGRGGQALRNAREGPLCADLGRAGRRPPCGPDGLVGVVDGRGAAHGRRRIDAVLVGGRRQRVLGRGRRHVHASVLRRLLAAEVGRAGPAAHALQLLFAGAHLFLEVTQLFLQLADVLEGRLLPVVDAGLPLGEAPDHAKV
mmetsp:Transcript_52373/g.135158  ORF Transcript_52373/g.135158 Transcript_52373/m.135158 type:complete len:210 (-) Transcript_52373:46-675(-)